ncbi:Probable folate-biopterin transporter 2 [Linum perenne]
MVEVEDENEEASGGEVMEVRKGGRGSCCWFDCLWTPLNWFKMLAKETHWSFVYGVLIVYGISQGFGGAFSRVGTEYYMKDVQKVQPSESQIYQGLISIPWLVKPIWGLLTDVIPILGYRRRPYFILAGLIGMASMLLLSLGEKMHLALALLLLITGSASVAIADVTVDACVAQKSNVHHSLAADMQSLCALSSSIGALVGFGFSGIFVHLLGPKGVFGLLAIPAGLVLSVGVLLEEPFMPDFSYSQVSHRFIAAGKAMWTTLNFPEVWRPCVYMYLSLAVSVNIDEGLFYWYTDSKDGPSFSQETVGFIFSIASIGSLLGAILYQNVLKDHPFRNLLFWTQLLSGFAGMLDLILVLRLNLKFGVPDYLFAVIDKSVIQMIGRLKWMPLLVLSSKLCPPGIEGTFFALLMSIDNLGTLSSSWGGGILLHLMSVTRTNFGNLWLVIILRNVLRVAPLMLLFLIPAGDPNASILPIEIMDVKEETGNTENNNLELVSLVSSTDDMGK